MAEESFLCILRGSVTPWPSVLRRFTRSGKVDILKPKLFPMKPKLPVIARILLPFFATAVIGQTAAPAQTPAPVPYSSVSQLNILLSQVEQTSQGMLADLSRVRIDKWKTDSNTKRGSQSDIESVQRNLQDALPEMLNQLRAAPESLPATFKLYRNFDALYDVFSSIVESAGAFGSKDDYQSLRNDLSELERSRKAFADRMDTAVDRRRFSGDNQRLRRKA